MINRKMSRRGAMGLDNVPNVAILLVIIATVFVVGYLVLAGLTTSIGAPANYSAATAGQKAATQAIGNFTSGMNNVVSFAPTWGTVIAAAVVLGIVIGGLYIFSRKREGY